MGICYMFETSRLCSCLFVRVFSVVNYHRGKKYSYLSLVSSSDHLSEALIVHCYTASLLLFPPQPCGFLIILMNFALGVLCCVSDARCF